MYLLGGNVGFGYSDRPNETTSYKTASFSISPFIGKFVSQKYLLSGGFGYGRLFTSYEVDETNWSRQTSNRLDLRFAVSRYIPIKEKLFLSLGSGISVGTMIKQSESEYNGTVTNKDQRALKSAITVSPGLAYFLNENWIIGASIGILRYEIDYDLDSKLVGHSVFGRASANSFTIGARYMFGKKKK